MEELPAERYYELRSPSVAKREFATLVEGLGLRWTDYERFVRERFPPPFRIGTREALGIAPVEIQLADRFWGETGPRTKRYEIRVDAEVHRVRVNGEENRESAG